MTEYEITNADQYVVKFKGLTGDDSDTKFGGESITGQMIATDFSVSQSGGTESKSGIGNHDTTGFSHGSNSFEHELEFEGENASVVKAIVNGSGKNPSYQIEYVGETEQWIVNHAVANDWDKGGSDGDAVTFTVSGPCVRPTVQDPASDDSGA